MAALSAIAAVENPNKVWSRVNMAVGALKMTEQAQRAFKDLKTYLSTQGRNPSLRYTFLSAGNLATSSTGDIVSGGAGAITIFGVYYKKNGTDGVGTSTASFLKIVDDGTDVALSGLATSVFIELSADVAGNESIILFPKGYAFANGLRAASVTTQAGLTIATAVNSGNGFVISDGAIVN
jgi:hypothetical protein